MANIEVKKSINKMKENAITTIMLTRSLLAETSSKVFFVHNISINSDVVISQML